MLGGDHGPLDHEDVQLGLEREVGVAAHALGGERGGGHHPALLDLADPPDDELLLDRLAVELLHPAGGLLVGERGDLLEDRLGVLVSGPQPLQVQDGEAAEPPDLDRRGRGHHGVHRRGHHRQAEPERVDLPGDVHVVGVPGAPGGDDRHLVEPVRPPGRPADADLDLHRTPRYGTTPTARDGRQSTSMPGRYHGRGEGAASTGVGRGAPGGSSMPPSSWPAWRSASGGRRRSALPGAAGRGREVARDRPLSGAQRPSTPGAGRSVRPECGRGSRTSGVGSSM